MERIAFGQNFRGDTVLRYTLSNSNGLSLSVMNHGATLLSLLLPEANGAPIDITLGHDLAAQYNADSACFGSVVGRYANRIRDARFTLDGQTYHLAANHGAHTLHGGFDGLDSLLWHEGPNTGAGQLELQCSSPDGDQGFPGQLDVSVIYRLTDENELQIEYRAQTSRPTPVNLTHHAYFNLRGHDAGDCLDHLLTIAADAFLPVDDQLIPTGERRAVDGTPFDFSRARRIGDGIQSQDAQIRLAGGYDHTFCLRPDPTSALREVARVREPQSGREMIVSTTEPGVQLYTGNQLHDRLIGKGGHPYQPYGGFCLETQHFPDSPNQADFPNTILQPGETFESMTAYRFEVPARE